MSKRLDQTIRNLIQERLEKWFSKREIARRLWMHPSSVCEEIKKNTRKWKPYLAKKAQMRAYQKHHMKRKKILKVRDIFWCEEFVRKELVQLVCPSNIVWHWNRLHPWYTISVPTLYHYLNSPYGRYYKQYLRGIRTNQKKRSSARKTMKSIIPFKVSIHSRPSYIGRRAISWHYECDLIMWTKTNKTCILTLVEMKTRFRIAVKCSSKSPEEIIRYLQLFVSLYHIKSLTFDNWVEFMLHYQLWIPTYFCDPYSSREKPQIERVNRDYRKFLPKKTNLDLVTQEQLDIITTILNNSPEGVLWYYTPQEAYTYLCT
jgi:IS30 family transposase